MHSHLGQAYFKLDETGISFKMDLFNKRIIQLSWQEIYEIKLKLFEIHVKLKDRWEVFNLEKLSDDNLKLVKSAFELKKGMIIRGV